MKKYLFTFFSVATLFVLAACSKEVNAPEKEAVIDTTRQDNNAVGSKVVTFTASIPEVKATLDAVNHKALWESTDVIGVYTKKGVKVEFTTEESGPSVPFSATIAADDEIETGAIFVYPASMLTDAGKITYPTSLPSAPLFPMAAKKTGSSLAFQFIGATLAVSIDNVPSTATYISMTANDIAGVFTIDSDLAIDAQTTTNVVTFPVSTPGANTVYFPVPAATYSPGNIAIRVGDASDVYFKKTNTSAWTLSVGEYKGMKALHIDSRAYLKSSWTNWDETATSQMISDGSCGYTLTLNAMADGSTKYVKVYMCYPGEADNYSIWRRMGPGAPDVSSSCTFVVDDDHSVGISSPEFGQYTFTYSSATAAFTMAHTRDYLDFYFYGAKNSWTLDKTYQLSYDSGLYSWEGIVGGQFKFYYNEYNGCVLGGDEIWLGADKGNISTTSDNYYIMLAKPDSWKYWMADMGNPSTTGSASNVSLTGAFAGWSTTAGIVEFTKDSGNGNIWRLTYTPTQSGDVKIIKDHAWTTSWGYSCIDANVAGVGGEDNFYLAKDTEYHIIMSVLSGKIAIY